MADLLRIDFETRSTVDLRNAGVYRYAMDPTTDVWCMAYRFDDEPVQMWSMGQPLPDRVREHVAAGRWVTAFNAPFERLIWNCVMHRRYGWPKMLTLQTECSATRARALSLPGHLEGAGSALGLAIQKDLEGHRLMMQMCRPRNQVEGQPIEWWDEPEKRARLEKYCGIDVDVEAEVAARTFALSPQERKVWLADQRINDRGIAIDVPLVHRTLAVVQYTQRTLNEQMEKTTAGFVSACTNVNRLRQWTSLRLGYKDLMPSLDAGTIDDMMALGAYPAPMSDEDKERGEWLESLGFPAAPVERVPLPEDVAQALQLRREAGKASTAKLNRMLDGVDADGRLRGLFMYHAAGTGRWAGSRVQPHNMPRPKLVKGPDQIEFALDIIQKAKPKDAMNELWRAFGMPLTVVADLLRSMFISAPGHVLRSLDFAGVEARGVNWLFGQDDMLAAFRHLDAAKTPEEKKARDVYVLQAKKVGSANRQLGKVVVLACGYQMGAGKFAATADSYDVKLTQDEAQVIVTAFREGSPAVKSGWREMNDAAIRAVMKPGEEVCVRGKITFKKVGSFLLMRLPSGRCLSYPYPEVRPDTFFWNGQEIETLKLRYKGQDTRNGRRKAWGWIDTYGGMLTENAVQAICRDALATAILNCEAKGYPVVLHVHDDVTTEVPEDLGSLAEQEALMLAQDEWTAGFPLAVEGFEAKRWRK